MWLRGRKGRKYTNKKVGTTCGTLQHIPAKCVECFYRGDYKKRGKNGKRFTKWVQRSQAE